MVAQKLPSPLHRAVLAAATFLICSSLVLLTGCGPQGDRKMTVLDPPVRDESEALSLDRVDRIDGLLTFDWISEDEVLSKAVEAPKGSYVIRHLQSGIAQPTSLQAKATADVSYDQKHLFLLDDLSASMVTLETNQILPLAIGDDHVSWIIREAHGAWVDNQTYLLPIVRGKNEYGVAFVKTDGTVIPLSLPIAEQPILKAFAKQDHLYLLDAEQKLWIVEKTNLAARVLREQVADFALSPDGATLAIAVHSAADEITLFFTSPSGEETGTLVAKGRVLQQLSWSPDSQRLAFTAFSLGQGMSGLFVIDAKTGSTLPLSTHSNLESPIIWSPTGRQLFVSESDRYSEDGSAHTMIFRLTSQ